MGRKAPRAQQAIPVSIADEVKKKRPRFSQAATVNWAWKGRNGDAELQRGEWISR